MWYDTVNLNERMIMSEKRWTPGDWKWVDFSLKGAAEYFDSGGIVNDQDTVVCHFGFADPYPPSTTEGMAPNEANKNLILASPKLYTSLERVIAPFDGMGEMELLCHASTRLDPGIAKTWVKDILVARKILAEARGEKS